MTSIEMAATIKGTSLSTLMVIYCSLTFITFSGPSALAAGKQISYYSGVVSMAAVPSRRLICDVM